MLNDCFVSCKKTRLACGYTPNGKLVSVTDSVLFETAGDYEFRVTAIDEAGNVSYKTFTVRVSEKEVNDDEKN